MKCFADPCQVNTCPEFPDAICKASYCGGCFANFYDGNGEIIEKCNSDKQCLVSGQVFTSCGSKCDKTCDNPDPVCTEACVSRCECPQHAPIQHEGKCITQNWCPKTEG